MLKVKKIFFSLILIFFIALMPTANVQAKTITQIDAFNGLSGDSQYLSDSYRSNYYLDMEDCGLLDSGYKLLNSIANVLFSLLKTFAYLVVSLFYHALTLDIGALFSDQINTIQAALHTSIFEPLLILALAGSAMTIIKRFIQQNMIGIISETAKVIFLMFCATILITNSETALSYINGLTKTISLSAMNNINGESTDPSSINIESYAAQTAGLLWQDLLHDPWVSLEFGDSNLSSDISSLTNSLLSKAPESDERAEIVENNKALFPKERASDRIGNSLLFIVILIVKGILYIVMALLMFAFQFITIFYFLLSIIVLILAFFPSYSNIVSIWFKKLLESQIAVFLMTLILGFVVKVDSVLASFSGSLGWLVVLVFQVAIAVTLFLTRNKILDAFGKVQRATESPAFASTLLRNMGNAQRVPENLNRIATSTSRAKDNLTDFWNERTAKWQEVNTNNQDIYARTYFDTAAKPARPNLEENIAQRKASSDNIVEFQKMSKKVTSENINYKKVAVSSAGAVKPSSSSDIMNIEFMSESVSKPALKAGNNITSNINNGNSNISPVTAPMPYSHIPSRAAINPSRPAINSSAGAIAPIASLASVAASITHNSSSPDMKTAGSDGNNSTPSSPSNRPVLSSSYLAEQGSNAAASLSAAPVYANELLSNTAISSNPINSYTEDKKRNTSAPSSAAHTAMSSSKTNESSVKAVPKPARSGSFTAIEVVVPASAKEKKERPKTDSKSYTEPANTKKNQKDKITAPAISGKHKNK